MTDKDPVSYEFVQRDGDLWKVAQDLAIDSDELNLLLLLLSDEFTVVSRTGRNRHQL